MNICMAARFTETAKTFCNDNFDSGWMNKERECGGRMVVYGVKEV